MSRRKIVFAVGVVLVVAITVLGVLQLLPDDTAESAEPASTAEDPPPSALEVTGAFLNAFTSGLGEVHGKTGTAQTTGSAHGWFTGYRDDLAFAVLVQDGQSSTAAVAVTRTFLSGPG